MTPWTFSTAISTRTSRVACAAAGTAPDGRALITAVAQDADTGRVLMVAWMDAAALAQTLTTRVATYYSRSRQELWVKGATSGHTQQVLGVAARLRR